MMSEKYLIENEEEIVLNGLKIVVNANELKTVEHRELSAYTKNLIK